MRGRAVSLPLKHFEDDDGIVGNVMHDAPYFALVGNPQFVTPRADRRHGARVWHGQAFAALQSAG